MCETRRAKWSVRIHLIPTPEHRGGSSTGTSFMQESGRHNQHFTEGVDRGGESKIKRKEREIPAGCAAEGSWSCFSIRLFLAACLSLPLLPARRTFLESYTPRHTQLVDPAHKHRSKHQLKPRYLQFWTIKKVQIWWSDWEKTRQTS